MAKVWSQMDFLRNYCCSCNLPILVQILAICKIGNSGISSFIHYTASIPTENQV